MQKRSYITGIEKVIFGVEDFDSCRKFLQIYGLTETVSDTEKSVWEALDGSGVELRKVDDPSLPPALVGGSTGRQYIWGVRDAEALEAIRSDLAKDRECVKVGDLVVSTDDDGHSIGFRVSTRKAYEVETKAINVAGMEPGRPVNQRVSFDTAGLAREAGHVVYWSRDPDRSFAFYRDRLGFRVTEEYEDKGGIFARADGHSDHHSIFFLNIKDLPFEPSLQHMQFHFGDFQEVLIIGQRLADAGFETGLGMGRHQIGSNWYWYFKSPLGCELEVGCDIDQADDNWVPGVHKSLQDVWGWSLHTVDHGF